MSWSPDLFIGEFRPWPDAVDVVRGTYDDTRRYVPEDERDMYRDLVGCMVHPDVSDQLQAENDRLRELVRDMWRFTGTACKKYPRLFDPSAQGGQMVQLNALDSFEQRMRESGIEVER